MVPSYSGTPCFFWWVTGLVQSLVPSARPMKLATPMGALSGNNLQVSLPAVVSMSAVGSAEAAVAGFAAVAAGFLAGGVGAACAHDIKQEENRMEKMRRGLRIGHSLDCSSRVFAHLSVVGKTRL